MADFHHDLPELDFRSGLPLKLQIAEFFRKRIRSGVIPPGQALPTCAELGATLGLAAHTVHRAFDLLAQEGLVYRRRSLGTIVGSPTSASSPSRSMAQRARLAAPTVSMVIRPVPQGGEISRVINSRLNDYLNGLFEGFNAWKCRFEIAYLQPDQPDLDLVKALVETGQTRGFITMSLHPAAIEYLVNQAIPMVNIDQDLTAQGVPSVITDHVKGYREVWEHAEQLGHRHAAFVRIGRTPVADERLRECTAGKELAGGSGRIDRVIEVPAETDSQAAWLAIEDCLGALGRGGSWPTLFLAQTDLLAIHLAQAFQAHGIDVPRDVSLIGSDDISVASLCHPPLTTLHLPRFKMALTAAQLLLQLLARRSVGTADLHVVPAHLVARASCASPRTASNLVTDLISDEETSVHPH